ncbi:hypothetical protein HID58_018421, partial [Brassica napus]
IIDQAVVLLADGQNSFVSLLQVLEWQLSPICQLLCVCVKNHFSAFKNESWSEYFSMVGHSKLKYPSRGHFNCCAIPGTSSDIGYVVLGSTIFLY